MSSTLFIWIYAILLIFDIESNPGPIKFPCGECHKAVRSNQHGIACDDCETWFHTKCIRMSDTLYYAHTSITPWTCFSCGIPNFSSTLFKTLPAELVLSTMGSFGPPAPETESLSPHPSLEGISKASSLSCNSVHENSVTSGPLPSPLVYKGPQPLSSTPTHDQPAPPNLNWSSPGQSSEFSSKSQTSYISKPVKCSSSLRSLTINFQSIREKKAELLNILETSEPDIVFGNETWLTSNHHSAEYFPPTYHVYRKDRKDGYGGVLLAVKSTLISHQLPVNNDSEAVIVSIKTTKPSEPLIAVSLYRTPSCNAKERLDQMKSIVTTLDSIKTEGVIWIGGDLNLKDIDWQIMKVKQGKRQYSEEFYDIFLDKVSDMGLSQMNLTPTRGNNILDIFLTNRPCLVSRCTTIPPLSDHDIVLTDSKIKAARIKPISRTISVWKKAEWTKMKEKTTSFSSELQNKQHLTVEKIWTEISTHLQNMMIQHVPTKKSSTKQHQPWINTNLKRIARRKYRAWRKKNQTKHPKDEARFHELKKETRRTNRKCYRQYVRTLVEENSNNLYKLIKNKRTDSMGVSPLKRNGLSFSDSKTKANILNDQFCNAFTREDLSNIPVLENSPHPSMPDILVEENGVKKLLQNLNPRKASGPDKIPCRLLKELASELAPALTLLFNKSLSTGEVPKIWKHALVQPIFKKGDRGQAANYRPISLTCICCKLLEHIVRTGITKHLESNKIISDAQHGFRKARSCETQLILTIHDFASEIDLSGQTDAILLDFSKAFDRVPHQRLLRKLDFYGIRGKINKWIESFLLNRTQQVLVEGETSCTGPVLSGVPQGSVLGPTLFLVYINDLGDGIKSTVRLFADDTMLYSSVREEADQIALQEDLNKLETWEERWQMSFNVDKCHQLTVTNKTKKRETSYTLHGQTLEKVTDAKYLGVEISEKLNWKTHINSITSKANKSSAFINRNLKGCSQSVQTHCFKAITRPVLEYASSVWDPPQIGLTNQIEMVQRRTARRIKRDFRPLSSASEMVKDLQLENLKTRRSIDKTSLLFKIVNGLVDITAPPGLMEPVTRHTRGHQRKFQVPSANTEVYRHSFFPATIRLWNQLPPETVEATSSEAFRNAAEGWFHSLH